MLNYKRYKRSEIVDFPERTWPNKKIDKYTVVDGDGNLWKGRWQTAVGKYEQISETAGTYYYNNYKWTTTKAQ
jgi:hypothetical protein